MLIKYGNRIYEYFIINYQLTKSIKITETTNGVCKTGWGSVELSVGFCVSGYNINDPVRVSAWRFAPFILPIYISVLFSQDCYSISTVQPLRETTRGDYLLSGRYSSGYQTLGKRDAA